MTGLLEKSVISPTFIGRAEQLAALRRGLELAGGGSGQTVLLSGEAGLGKTRLTAEIQNQAELMGFVTLRCHCLEPDQPLPYAPAVELLRGYLAGQPANTSLADLAATFPELSLILPELAAGLAGQPTSPPETDKYGLFYAVERFLFGLAAQAPLLLVVEDLHWCDDASLDLLLHLAQRLSRRPVLLLLTYRSEAAGGTLGRFLLALDRARQASELVVAPFTPAEVDAMLRAIFEQQRPVSADFLSTICQLTEGNPFFIEEVLKSLLAAGSIFLRNGVWDRKPLEQLSIPRSIQAAVEQRLAQLPAETRQLTCLAAVVGRRFSFRLLQALTGISEPALLAQLKQLVSAQIIVEETAEVYAFRHALTREAVYSTLLQRERQQHHRRVAQLLEQLQPGPGDTYAAELAFHYYYAGEWAGVGTHAQRAGDRARALYAPREAVEQYSRALEAAERLGQPPAPALRRARGQAYETLGEIEMARADYERALHLAQQAGDPRAEWQALVDLGFLWTAQDYQQAGDYFRRALALAQAQADARLLAHSLNRLGNWHTNIDQHQAACNYHHAALAHFERLDDQRGRAETLDLLGLTLSMSGNYEEGLSYSRQAASLFEEQDDRRGLASCLAVMGCGGGSYLGDRISVAPIHLPEAAGHAAQALRLSRQIGLRSGEAYALSVLSICVGSLGQFEQALEHAHRAVAIAAEIEHRQWLSFAHLACGLAYGSVLALPAARRHHEEALGLAREVKSQFWHGLASAFLAGVLVRQREFEQAGRLLASTADDALATFRAKLAASVTVDLALATGRGAAAEPDVKRLLAAVVPERQTPRQPWQAAPRLLLQQGQVLAAQRRYAEALPVLETALGAARAQGARPLEWEVLAAIGHCWRRQRQFEAADAAFAAARSVIENLADAIANPDLRGSFCAGALAQLPEPRQGARRRALKREFGGLTVREREVAALVGQGGSNRAIAAQLVLSERTVEKHISNILGKLGLETRRQLSAWAQENGLTATSSV